MKPIETKRLVLREFEIADAEAVLQFGSHPQVCRYTCDANVMATVDDAREVIAGTWHCDYRERGYGRWAVVEKATSRVFGFCGLKYLEDLQETDIGYRFLPEYWGRGIATEAAEAVMAFGREVLGLETIIGLVVRENVASQRVLEKVGLRYAEELRIDSHTAMVFREPTDLRRFAES